MQYEGGNCGERREKGGEPETERGWGGEDKLGREGEEHRKCL